MRCLLSSAFGHRWLMSSFGSDRKTRVECARCGQVEIWGDLCLDGRRLKVEVFDPPLCALCDQPATTCQGGYDRSEFRCDAHPMGRSELDAFCREAEREFLADR